MKKFIVMLVLGLFVVPVFLMQAFADKQGYGKPMQMSMYQENACEEMLSYKSKFIMENSAELGLSDEQLERIKATKLNAKKSKIKSEAEAELFALDIKEALSKDDPDINNINTLIDKKYNIKAQSAKVLAAAFVEMKKVLTKEQVKKLREIWMREKKEAKCMMMGDDESMMGHSGKNQKSGVRKNM